MKNKEESLFFIFIAFACFTAGYIYGTGALKKQGQFIEHKESVRLTEEEQEFLEDIK